MNINSSVTMPPSHTATARPDRQSKENSSESLVIDLTKVGDVLETGIKVVGGTTSAVLQSPKTLFAPTVANLVPGHRKSGEVAVGAGVGGTVFGTFGYLIGGSPSFAGNRIVGAVLFGVLGAWAGAGLAMESNGLFDYGEIDKARAEAFQTASGNTARKNGAAFTQGYKTALEDSFQDGTKAVESVGNAISSGLSFLDGAVRPGK